MKSLRLTSRNLFRAFGLLTTIICSSLLLAGNAIADDSPKDAIGAIEGAAIQVSGPMTIDVIAGQTKTMLRSGSEVHVKSGSARINLVEGGSIVICGPAHFSVLKSGGAITVALDTGTLRARFNSDLALTIYTPQIQAKPISVGEGMEDIFVGLDAAGSMCLRANRGAVRLEQQLTGQSIIVPQGGEISLNNGQLEGLRNTTGRCLCEFTQTDMQRPEVSRLATEEEVRSSAAETKKTESDKTSEEKQEPVYQVFMPPLRFDASAKIQPEPDPRMILLVRRIRVRPTLIFQGRVEGEAVAAQPGPGVAQQPKPVAAATPAKNPPGSLANRVRKFFHGLWGSSS
ncbi:MAG TPA: hypothetical protein VFF42_08405 [Candidatus Eremiobacteraceae bacterium]|nr:hypothetical protein [Candidatus Eremiobacteraceae bacterium]